MEQLRKEMEQYAQAHDIPIMQEAGMVWLRTWIEEHKVKTILELGSAIGYSAIQMASIDKDIHIVTIERDSIRYEEALKNIARAGMQDQIEIHLADALTYETDAMFDLLFIDAAKAQYVRFFERYKQNVQVSGAIVSDNLKFHGMVDSEERIANRNTRQLVKKIKHYITYLQRHQEFATTFYDVGDGVAVSRWKSLAQMSKEELWELFPISLEDHNPQWILDYEKEKEQLWATIAPLSLYHIGSTGIAGLRAKPIIDILLEVDATTDIPQLKQTLLEQQYIVCSQAEKEQLPMLFIKGYSSNGFVSPVYHLHVRNEGDVAEVYFCEYVKQHKDVATAYAELKQELFLQYEHDRDAYMEAKTEFIKKYTDLAIKKSKKS